MKKLIFISAILVIVSCHNEDKSEEISNLTPMPELIGYIHNPSNEFSDAYVSHMRKVADYTKLGMKTYSINEFESKPLSNEMQVLLINSTKELSEAGRKKLLRFVVTGGTLILPNVNEDPNAKLLSGVNPNSEFEYDTISTGIHFTTPILPGLKGASIYTEKLNTSLSKRNFVDSNIVLAVAANDRSTPIILENPIGDGKVIHFNTSIFFGKADRGLLFAAVLRGLEGIPFPIVNVATIFLDDFPMPLYELPSEPVFSQMRLTSDQFVLDVWWKDMLKLAEKYDLKYAAYPCYDYNRVYTAPFPFEEWDRHKTEDGKNKSSATWLASNVLDEGHELAFHGYNHESLMQDIWPSGDAIEASLKAVRKKWTLGNQGKMPTSYVPPSNEIDSFGIAHLHRAMPELKYICSTYDGEFEIGGDREFDPEPYESEMFGFPRVSSGYTINERKNYTIQSLFLYTGIWSHFVHPDDVYQLPDSTNRSAGKYDYRNAERLNWRSEKKDKGMLEYFEEYLLTFNELHPNVEYVTVTEAGKRTENWREVRLSAGENYQLTNLSESDDTKFTWHVYLENNQLANQLRAQAANMSSTKMGNGFLYTIITDKPQLKLPNTRTTTSWSESEINEIVLDFQASASEEEEVVYQESEENDEPEPPTEEELWMEQMKEMEATAWENLAAIDSSDFQRLVTYWLDQDREMEIWKYLDRTYEDDALKGLSFHDQYQDEYEYPTDAIAKAWLTRILTNEPDSKEALAAYKSYFYTTEELEATGQLFDDIQRKTGSKEAYAQYIQYLIDFQPQKVTTELADKNPEQYPELWHLSDPIASLYADEQQFEEALTWAEHGDIPLLTRLQWWAELEAYNSMQDEYDNAMVQEKTDTTTAFVSNIWLDLGKVKKSTVLANGMTEGEPKEGYKSRLNTEVPNITIEDQWYLLENTPDLLYEDRQNNIKKGVRIAYGDAVEFTSSYVFDNFEQSNWDNTLSYHLRTEKRHLHLFSALHSYVSDIQLNETDVNNLDHTLVGFGYRFQTEENTPKPLIYFNGGVMQGSRSQTFFNVGAGISHATSKLYKSAGLLYAPMMTGPSLTREVYKTEFTGYLERDADHFTQPSIALIGTNYTTSANSIELTGRSFFNLKRDKLSRFSPFVEAYGTVANQDQLDGNPFWIIRERVYAGGGTAWTHGKFDSPLYVRLEGGVFADTFTDYFVRVNGEARYIVKDYTYLTARFEVFNQARYYSNAFFVGVKHYLKPRKKRFYDSRIFKD